ncbi:MAG: hypothetical protein P8P74_03645 [Crocinitomicaceae bacterium]|nr:hypothetical protein [Crocinitomicaceae bacterium]
MKKLVYTLMLLVGFATVSFAQEASEIVVTEGSEELTNSKKYGDYVFVMSGKTEGEITEKASRYTLYFTVVFDEPSQTVKLEMVENDSRARSVIMRFLVSSGIRHADVDGKIIPINEFMTGYLQ